MLCGWGWCWAARDQSDSAGFQFLSKENGTVRTPPHSPVIKLRGVEVVLNSAFFSCGAFLGVIFCFEREWQLLPKTVSPQYAVDLLR